MNIYKRNCFICKQEIASDQEFEIFCDSHEAFEIVQWLRSETSDCKELSAFYARVNEIVDCYEISDESKPEKRANEQKVLNKLVQLEHSISHFIIKNKIVKAKGNARIENYIQYLRLNYLGTDHILCTVELKFYIEKNKSSGETRYTKKDSFDALTDGQLGNWEDFDGDVEDARGKMGLD